jgi:hypothetical protein
VLVRVSARSGHIISAQVLGRHRGDKPRCWLPEGCS